MEPILTYSEITGRVYIVTKYKRLNGGVIDAQEKFDVTEWVESYAKKCNAQTVEENAKLRELVRRYGEYTDQDRCEGCVCKSRCNDGDVDECWQLTEIRGLARELWIEVNDG